MLLHLKKYLLCLACTLFLVGINSTTLFAQKGVGIVLSGGGAKGIAHIGMLKALEENDIPIDYIAGSSIGALIGSLYAAGFSPDEILQLIVSEQFIDLVEGDALKNYYSFYTQPEHDASLVGLKLSSDSILQIKWPTNLRKTYGVDYNLAVMLSPANAVARSNFDSLFVPFRCVGSVVDKRKQLVFKSGDLAKAVRASMTYPFFFWPLRIDGHLVFDGGLYNNFPKDILRKEFNPEFVIGSNVAGNSSPSREDDLLSQLENMLTTDTDYFIPDSLGILIQHELNLGTFQFEIGPMLEAFALGYQNTISLVDSIKNRIDLRRTVKEVENKRNTFKNRKPPFIVENATVIGLKSNQAENIKKSLFIDKAFLTAEEFKFRYFKMLSEDKLAFVHPSISYNEDTQKFTAELTCIRNSDLEVNLGGNFSNRPINTGFLSVKYRLLKKNDYTLGANGYFGRFYTSANLFTRIGFPGKRPFYIEPQVRYNRFDFFNSNRTFFLEENPAFIINSDLIAGVNIGLPIPRNNKVEVSARYLNSRNSYYQTRNFSPSDTADVTNFIGFNATAEYLKSNLNRKMYASEGTKISIRAKYFRGEETTMPGSTSQVSLVEPRTHQWASISAHLEQYFKLSNRLSVGVTGNALISSIFNFNNFTATLLNLPAYEPIPELQIIFLPELRSYYYAAGGTKAIFNLRKNLDFRVEGYIFQPFTILSETEDQQITLSQDLRQNIIASSSLTFHSPLGPLNFSVNFVDTRPDKYSFLIHFGYILFNKRTFN
ncbi:MAG: patatin-like phospholipase family protein [Luteibaculaceae bacterium]